MFGVDVEGTSLCLRGRGSAVMKPYLILGVDNWKHCQFIAFYSDLYNFFHFVFNFFVGIFLPFSVLLWPMTDMEASDPIDQYHPGDD